MTDEGRLVPNGSNYDSEYFIKDHLGNTRVVVKDNNGKAEVMQESHYYPFGMTMEGMSYSGLLSGVEANKYLYNGKELQDDLGLDWYDYGARFYDAQLARFHSVDPKAEEFKFQSSYVYASNDPIKFIDLNGENAWIPTVKDDKLALVAEKGDNAETLKTFLNTSEEKAEQLYSSMENGVVTLTDDIPGVAPINAAIKDAKENPGDYDNSVFPTNYNCWESSVKISKNETPNFKNVMPLHGKDGFKDQIVSDYKDVTDKPKEQTFGKTVIRFAEQKSNLFSKYSVTTHAATYLGTSKNGTQYTWSKNGSFAKPGIFKLSTIIKKYGKVEGYRAEPGGGYYNPK